MEKKQYSTGNLKATAHLRVAEYLLHDLLSCVHPRQQTDYVSVPGSTPFFNGLKVVKDASLCVYLKQKLEDQPSDATDVKGKQDFIRTCVRTISGHHNKLNTFLNSLYLSDGNDAKAMDNAHQFIRKLLTSAGLSMRCSNQRKSYKLRYHTMTTPAVDFALVLCLKEPFRSHVMELLPVFNNSCNLSEPDKEWLKDAIDIYNKAAETHQQSQILHDILKRRERIYPVIPQRLQESAVERSSLPEPQTARETNRTLTAANTLLALSDQVNALEAQMTQAVERRRLRAVRTIREEDIDDDTCIE